MPPASQPFTQPTFVRRPRVLPFPCCPVPDCTARRAQGRIMCRPHWRQVSALTQRVVLNRWAQWRAARDADVAGDLTAELRADYHAAREQAIREAST